MVRVNTGTIVGMILSLVFIMVLFSMLPTILPTVALKVADLFNTTNMGATTTVGAGPASFAANVSSYLGWFWVVGPFVLVIGVILSLFLSRGGRR